MAKAKSNHRIYIPIFWLIFSILIIMAGINGINDIYRYVQPLHMDAWQKIMPYSLIIFGGMVLGVSLNKFSQSLKENNGKRSK
jgi:hypothetical protein